MATIGYGEAQSAQRQDIVRIREETEQLKDIHAQSFRELVEIELRTQQQLRRELDEMERRKGALRTFEEHRAQIPVPPDSPLGMPGSPSSLGAWNPVPPTHGSGYSTN